MSIGDVTFITNEEGNKISDRFKTLIKDTQFFDVLVGYFYTSGFWQIYPEIEKTEKIRILVGINTNRETHDAIKAAREMSQVERRAAFCEQVKREMDSVRESENVEDGIRKFVEWIRDGKLEIRAYPDERLHAKLYVMSFRNGDRDVGRVITWSSNFTQSGLNDNLEFNVELKDPSDYEYAKKKFEELWSRSVDVSEKYVETVENDTWMNDGVTPYELYVKFLYEYFKQDLEDEGDVDFANLPPGFKKLKYQTDAVLNAERIVKEHGGVFISDVVGLGKTFMGTMLAARIAKKTLVIAPPRLTEESNPWSWYNAFKNFGFRTKDYKCASVGILDKIVKWDDLESYDTVIIDESHRFRNEGNQTFSHMSDICIGKKVILLTATPFNNDPSDILSQLKLFQPSKNSTIPGILDLESYFSQQRSKLSAIDRSAHPGAYSEMVRHVSKNIRNNVLKHVMVRRTRKEVAEFYGNDLAEQGMRFPKVAEPEGIFYGFSERESEVFRRTVEIFRSREENENAGEETFGYSRYAPLLHLRSKISGQERQGQKNMQGFMKMLIVKRLESSFHAFRQTLGRFITSHEQFLRGIDENWLVYVSETHARRIYDALDSDDYDLIDELVISGRARPYPIGDFSEDFRAHIEKDLKILKELKSLWDTLDRDPKLEKFARIIKDHPALSSGKLLVFSESKETATYLATELRKRLATDVFLFTGSNGEADRRTVIENFDANAKTKLDDYRILVTTDVLSEGVNLHRGNVVINYDIPWNPTRVMQRVGRVNRVDTPHETIRTFTCFPTDEGNAEMNLRENATNKIAMFVSMLGSDAKLLTGDEEIESHALFNRILSAESIEGEEAPDGELKYLTVIRNLRGSEPELFAKLVAMPKKSRSAMERRFGRAEGDGVLTYFRKGRIEKFVYSGWAGPEELEFSEAAKRLECVPDTPRISIPPAFYGHKNRNAEFFESITARPEVTPFPSVSNEARILHTLNSDSVRLCEAFTDAEEVFLEQVRSAISHGLINSYPLRKIRESISETPEIVSDPRLILDILRRNVPRQALDQLSDMDRNFDRESEVVLSMYFSN